MRRVARHYLDNAATTPVDPAVIAQMRECLGEDGCVCQSFRHRAMRPGAPRRSAWNWRAPRSARLIGALPEQIVFTSGATEADNLAVLGTARALAPGRRHVISARTEHKAVLDAVRQLTREGFTRHLVAAGRRRPGQCARRRRGPARRYGAGVPDARQQ